ncbi:MAG: hypothetical protein PHI73_01745 [Patescibacteria group bacterium]|nr:hypothetical protein [Patescibacteria group bacterium]
MGEILKFNPNRQTGGENGQPESELIMPDADRVDFFTKFLSDGSAGKLMSLDASTSSSRQSREIVTSYTFDELFDWLEKSSENDWKIRPAFYQAVFEELKSRLDHILKKFHLENKKE